jgi:LytS/YehU family sensor histidine kinase
MNPHFTFNALYSIKNQIATDQKTATDYLLKFSRLLRLILENSIQNFVELQLELELLEKYLALQLFRFPDKFTYSIQLKNIDEDDLLFIPPMLFQPFIENSIEHGFHKIDYKGHINITLEKQDALLFCSIEDNGTGWSSKSQHKKSSSVELISDFILKTTKKPVKLTNISDTDPHKTGLRVELYVPFKFTEND